MTQKELIVEHAMKMFVSQGVKAVRMDDIAHTLSVSKRTLYELFGDKEELLYLSLKAYSEKKREHRLEAIKSIDNELEVMVLSLRDKINEVPVSRRMRSNMRRFYPNVYSRLENDLQIISRSDLKRWLTQCVEKGYMTHTSNCDFVVNVLQESVQGILISDSMENRDSVELIAMMSYSLVIFIRGLCTVKGIEIIDRCFDKYFGNIPAMETL